MSTIISRRDFLGGLLAAPAVVKFGSLMPVRGIVMDVPEWEANSYTLRTGLPAGEWRILWGRYTDYTQLGPLALDAKDWPHKVISR